MHDFVVIFEAMVDI